MAKRASTTVGDICRTMEAIAPKRLAQDWDNVGLLVGNAKTPCRRVLLAIDTSSAVLAEATKLKCSLLISYHPVLFRPIKNIRATSADADALAYDAIRRSVSIYSPHTALDAAEGGTNDVLASLCGLNNVGPFEYVPAGSGECKIVTFVPPEAIDLVADAMFSAGGGRIGLYEKCSYRLRGRGTFFGTEATNPAVGRKGQLEYVDEIRLEMVVPQSRVPEVVEALNASHPYEVPAYDLYPLQGQPEQGIGRVGDLPSGMTLGALAKSLARKVQSSVTQIVGDPKKKITRAAVCVGSAGHLPLEHARSSNADVIVTGEIRHHDALNFLRNGKCAIALGHWESERPALATLARRLKAEAGIEAIVSKADTGPFRAL